MYRPPTRPPTGTWAVHLHDQRRRRDLSQTQAFELVRDPMGLSPKSRATYIALDMGDRQPREDEAAVLAAEFGWPPEPTSEAAGAIESGDDLGSAIRSQTEAIAALVAELQAEREERAKERAERVRIEASYRAEMDARVAFLESVVRSLRPRPANPGDRARPAQPVTVES